MKNLSSSHLDNIKSLAIAIMLGLLILILTGTAAAQAPVKNKKNEKSPQTTLKEGKIKEGKKNDRLPQATLKEAKVTAKVITAVEEVGPMKVRLNVLNPTGKTVRISIMDYSNTPVFRDSFKEREYNKILNFNTTPSGRYSLHVNGHKQSDVRRFAINSKEERNLTQSELTGNKSTDVMAAIHKTTPTQIMLHLVNNTGKPVSYIIRNNDNEVLHRGSVKDKQFSKSFNMASVTDGKYTLEVNYMADKTAARTFDMKTVYARSFAWTNKRGRPISPLTQAPANQSNTD